MISPRTALARLAAAWRVLRGRRPLPNAREHGTADSWVARAQGYLAEGYILQHGFCPECGAYSLTMCPPESAGTLGECPDCRRIITAPGTAQRRAALDLSPTAMAKHPPFLPLADLRQTLQARNVFLSRRDTREVWQALANRILAHYDA